MDSFPAFVTIGTPVTMRAQTNSSVNLVLNNYSNPVYLDSGSVPGLTYDVDMKTLSGTPTTPGTYLLHFIGSDLYLEITVDPICIIEPTRILSPLSYVPISSIKAGDQVVSAKTRDPVKVLEVGYSIVSPDSVQPDNVPCVFEKGVFGNGFPINDLHLSGYHAVFLEPVDGLSKGVNTFKIPGVKRLPFDTPVKYYYIKVEGGDPIIAEGIYVESSDI
jgi:hypothetical protein